MFYGGPLHGTIHSLPDGNEPNLYITNNPAFNRPILLNLDKKVEHIYSFYKRTTEKIGAVTIYQYIKPAEEEDTEPEFKEQKQRLELF